MDQCTPSNIKTIVIFVVLVMAAVGIWNFHEQYTCAKSKDKRSCTSTSFFVTIVVLATGLLVAMYYAAKRSPNATNEVSNVAVGNTANDTTDIGNDLE